MPLQPQKTAEIIRNKLQEYIAKNIVVIINAAI